MAGKWFVCFQESNQLVDQRQNCWLCLVARTQDDDASEFRWRIGANVGEVQIESYQGAPFSISATSTGRFSSILNFAIEPGRERLGLQRNHALACEFSSVSNAGVDVFCLDAGVAREHLVS